MKLYILSTFFNSNHSSANRPMTNMPMQNVTSSLKISPLSSESTYAPLDIFKVPPTHSSVLGGNWNVVTPTHLNETGNNLEFNVLSSSEAYIDLSKTKLYVEIQVTKADGSAIAASAQPDDILVWPGDNGLSSLFSSANLEIASQHAEHVPNYPYRAFVENLFNTSKVSKNTSLNASGWIEDKNTGKSSDGLNDDDTKARKLKIAAGKTICYFGKLHLSTFQQDRYLIPSVDLQLTLERNKPEFCLMSGADTPAGGAQIKIMKAELHIRQVSVLSAIQLAHQNAMFSGVTAKYHQNHVSTRWHAIAQGVEQAEIKLVTQGQKPNRIVFGLTSHSGRSGKYKQNPFRFEPYGISSIEIYVDGQPIEKRLEPNFDEGKYIKEYSKLLATCGYDDDSETNCGLTLESFAKGFTLFGFDLTGDMCNEDGVHLIQKGTITLFISFKNPTVGPLSLLSYEERDSMWELDAEHKLYSSMSVVG